MDEDEDERHGGWHRDGEEDEDEDDDEAEQVIKVKVPTGATTTTASSLLAKIKGAATLSSNRSTTSPSGSQPSANPSDNNQQSRQGDKVSKPSIPFSVTNDVWMGPDTWIAKDATSGVEEAG
jgi:hypothetical protein